MKLTVKDIFELNEGLTRLSEKEEIKVGVGFKIARISRKVGEEFATAQKSRSKLLDKYKDEDLGNGKIKLKEDKLDEFNEKIDELMKEEVDIDIQKISVDELKSVAIAPKVLAQLHTILEEAK